MSVPFPNQPLAAASLSKGPASDSFHGTFLVCYSLHMPLGRCACISRSVCAHLQDALLCLCLSIHTEADSLVLPQTLTSLLSGGPYTRPLQETTIQFAFFSLFFFFRLVAEAALEVLILPPPPRGCTTSCYYSHFHYLKIMVPVLRQKHWHTPIFLAV